MSSSGFRLLMVEQLVIITGQLAPSGDILRGLIASAMPSSPS